MMWYDRNVCNGIFIQNIHFMAENLGILKIQED